MSDERRELSHDELLDCIYLAYRQLLAGKKDWAQDTLRHLLDGRDPRPAYEVEQLRRERLEREVDQHVARGEETIFESTQAFLDHLSSLPRHDAPGKPVYHRQSLATRARSWLGGSTKRRRHPDE